MVVKLKQSKQTILQKSLRQFSRKVCFELPIQVPVITGAASTGVGSSTPARAQIFIALLALERQGQYQEAAWQSPSTITVDATASVIAVDASLSVTFLFKLLFHLKQLPLLLILLQLPLLLLLLQLPLLLLLLLLSPLTIAIAILVCISHPR